MKWGYAQHRPWTQNATKDKKGVETINIVQFWRKNMGLNMTFIRLFFSKYRGRNYTFSPDNWQREVEIAEHT